MNKPVVPPVADDDIGTLDEHGQQLWSREEEAAIERLRRDPEYLAGIAEAEAQIERGEFFTSHQVQAHMAQLRCRFLAERGR